MIGSFSFVFGASLLTSLLLTRFVRNLAISRGWQSGPTEERHIHKAPIPRLGGVAVYMSQMGTFGGLLLFLAARHPSEPAIRPLVLFVPATLVFVLGLCDDLFNLSPVTKVSVQILAGSIVYGMGLRIGQIALLKSGSFGAISSYVLTVGWILLITNSFNLIDGLDGLAAGSALFSTFVLFIVSLLSHAPWIALFALSLSGAILGFLRFNFNPATIFLGDCGSLFIGFTLAVVSLASSQKAPTMVAVGIPVVCFGLPILDVAMAILRRFLNGRNLFKPDGEHIHHRLLRNGLSHRTAVLVLYAVSAFFGLLSLALLHPNGTLLALILAVIACGVLLFVGRLGYHEVDELRRLAFRTVTQRDVISHNLRFRRAGEELRECNSTVYLEELLNRALGDSPFDGCELKYGHGLEGGGFDKSAFEYCWHGGKSRPLSAAAWKLQLGLCDHEGRMRGTVAFIRYDLRTPLPMDINVLTEHFQSALSTALDNCVKARHPATLAAVEITGRQRDRYAANGR